MVKKKAGNGFGHDVTGHTFEVNGVTVEVVAVDPYPQEIIPPSWKNGVMSAEEGEFICAFLGKYLIPVIRCKGGVVKLTEVIVNGKKLTKAHEIATLLGATKHFIPYKLKRKD